MRSTYEESSSDAWSQPRSLIKQFTAGLLLSAALLIGLQQPAEALPSPLPTMRTDPTEQARQTIERQMAIDIAQYLVPQLVEDGRSQPFTWSYSQSDIGDQYGLQRGPEEINGHPGTTAGLEIGPVNSVMLARYRVNKDTGSFKRREVVTATVGKHLAQELQADFDKGATPDPSVAIQIASDPTTTFVTALEFGSTTELRMHFDGSAERGVDDMPIGHLASISQGYMDFMELNN